MKRHDYIEQLNKAIELASAQRFDYGAFNCGLFAALCIDATVEGSRRVDELKGQFSDEATARAFVEREGGIEAAVTRRLGAPLPWWKAKRGDVCLMMTQEGPGLGVLHDPLNVAMLTPTGIAYLKVDAALKIWRVM